MTQSLYLLILSASPLESTWKQKSLNLLMKARDGPGGDIFPQSGPTELT